MAEKRTVEVIVGKKVEGTPDPAKGGKDASAPPSAEVGGRRHDEVVICPWCGSYRFVNVSDRQYEWFTCGNCGHAYRA